MSCLSLCQSHSVVNFLVIIIQDQLAVTWTLLEERRISHKEQWNNEKLSRKFMEGDVVKAHIQVQSRKESGEVGKLS